MIATYKRVDDQKLWVYGHFNDAEQRELKLEGYKIRTPQYNRNGIRICTKH